MNALKDLEKTLETYFLHKAPKMPSDIQELIVKYGPWVLLVIVVLSIPSVLGMLGLGAFVSPYSKLAMETAGSTYTVRWVLSIIALLMYALALPGLFKKEMRSWRLLFYAGLVSVLGDLVVFNIIGLIIGAAITFYILFQIRHHYK